MRRGGDPLYKERAQLTAQKGHQTRPDQTRVPRLRPTAMIVCGGWLGAGEQTREIALDPL